MVGGGDAGKICLGCRQVGRGGFGVSKRNDSPGEPRWLRGFRGTEG